MALQLNTLISLDIILYFSQLSSWLKRLFFSICLQ